MHSARIVTRLVLGWFSKLFVHPCFTSPRYLRSLEGTTAQLPVAADVAGEVVKDLRRRWSGKGAKDSRKGCAPPPQRSQNCSAVALFALFREALFVRERVRVIRTLRWVRCDFVPMKAPWVICQMTEAALVLLAWNSIV